MKKDVIVYEKDELDFSRIIEPKLIAGEPLELFCSMTYITPNYAVCYILKRLAILAKKGFTINLVLWDVNVLTHLYSRRFGRERKKGSFIEEKISEIKRITRHFGLPPEKLRIFRSSEIWKRLILLEDPPLFVEAYEILTDLRVDELHNPAKVSHLIQMPIDVFVMNFFHLLYPESIKRPIDVAFVGLNKEIIYTTVRRKMQEKGIINIRKPLFLLGKDIPYMIVDNKLPEWNMELEEIIYLITHFQPSKEEIINLFDALLEGELDEYFLSKGHDITSFKYPSFKKQLKELNEEELWMTLARNLYAYLQNIKNDSQDIHEEDQILRITDREMAHNIGRVLRSRIFLDILRLADGTRNLTQMSRELKKQIANVSVYLNELKKLKLVSIDEKGNICRRLRGITLNLDTGLATK
ncbi:hypothetical protein GOV10_03960 [Candidatus Woesearchaeota archaeon]|nr:hypothetical protein [Candidatus Woesearchaeota archaeon]